MEKALENTYVIPAENIDRLSRKINAYANKANDLGIVPPSIEILGSRYVEEKLGVWPSQRTITRKVYDVRVFGQAPKIEGWRLVAIIDHYSSMEMNVNLIRRIPHLDDETQIPDEFRTVAQRCDQCKTHRRRKDTFALQNDEGEWMLVGRNCLKLYMGYKSPDALASFYEHLWGLMDSAQEDGWAGSASYDYSPTYDFLVQTAGLIEKYGWCSSRRSQEEGVPSTCEMVLDPKVNPDTITDEMKYLVNRTLQWAREVLPEKEHLNDYEWNLMAALAEDHFHLKNAGIVASAIMAYRKFADLFEEKETCPSTHQGEIGDMIDRVLTVEKRVDLDSDWGAYRITIMNDEDGNIYVWKTSVKLEEGCKYLVRGKVKAHDHYNGKPQTVLERCRAKEIEGET